MENKICIEQRRTKIFLLKRFPSKFIYRYLIMGDNEIMIYERFRLYNFEEYVKKVKLQFSAKRAKKLF